MPHMAEPRRVALVTGGAKRVGRAIVERLAQDHFDVAFTYLSSEVEAAEFRSRLEGAGAAALAIKADFTHAQRAADTVSSAFAGRFERLDVLVNSASLYESGPLDDADLQQSRRLMAVHFETPLLLCQAFAPLLRRNKGHVVNMLDLLAERPWPKYLAYCASKAALWNLTLGLARELAPDVTVNGIAPGVVEWPDDYPPEEREKYLRRVPLARAGTPQDVAEVVRFLVSAGSYITGQVIRLDGGRSIT